MRGLEGRQSFRLRLALRLPALGRSRAAAAPFSAGVELWGRGNGTGLSVSVSAGGCGPKEEEGVLPATELAGEVSAAPRPFLDFH